MLQHREHSVSNAHLAEEGAYSLQSEVSRHFPLPSQV